LIFILLSSNVLAIEKSTRKHRSKRSKLSKTSKSKSGTKAFQFMPFFIHLLEHSGIGFVEDIGKFLAKLKAIRDKVEAARQFGENCTIEKMTAAYATSIETEADKIRTQIANAAASVNDMVNTVEENFELQTSDANELREVRDKPRKYCSKLKDILELNIKYFKAVNEKISDKFKKKIHQQTG